MIDDHNSIIPEETIRKLQERLRLVAATQMGDVADDLVQETLFAFFDNLHRGKYRGGDTYPEYFSYALGILKVIIIKEIKQKQKQRHLFTPAGYDQLDERVILNKEDSGEDRIIDSEAAGHIDETVRQAREVFTTLPEHLQELIYLHVIQEWSYSRLADHFRIPKQTLVSRFNAAMSKIRRKMKNKIHTKSTPEY